MSRFIFHHCLRCTLLFIAGTAILSVGCHRPDVYSDPNLKFYAKVRDFIQTDTLTRSAFDHPDPLRVWVLEETTCHGINTWDFRGVLECMGLQWEDRDEQRRLEDSLQQHAPRVLCDPEINPALRRLSTTDDLSYAVVFMEIDSVLIPGYYVLTACLSDNHCRENDIDGVLAQRTMWYALVLGKDAEVCSAVSSGPSSPLVGIPCD